VAVCRLDQFRSEKKKETRMAYEDRSYQKVPEVVKTAYGLSGELKVVSENVNL
jgi:hypothetical protein